MSDGDTLASISVDVWFGESFVESDNAVKLWDVQTGIPRATLKRNKLRDFAFSPDGKLLATGGGVEQGKGKWEFEVVLWDAKIGEMKRTLPANSTVSPLSLAFSPDGRTLAVAGAAKAGGEISLIPLK